MTTDACSVGSGDEASIREARSRAARVPALPGGECVGRTHAPGGLVPSGRRPGARDRRRRAAVPQRISGTEQLPRLRAGRRAALLPARADPRSAAARAHRRRPAHRRSRAQPGPRSGIPGVSRRGGRRAPGDPTPGVRRPALRLERMVRRWPSRHRHGFLEMVGDSKRRARPRCEWLPRSLRSDTPLRWDGKLLRRIPSRLQSDGSVALPDRPGDGCDVPQHHFRKGNVLLSARRPGALSGYRAGIGKRPRPSGLRPRSVVAVWNGRVCLDLRSTHA